MAFPSLNDTIDHRIDAVFYNEYPYNRIPQRMIRNIRDEGDRTEISLRYLESTKQQYLDAFGWPIEPLEYAFPHGTVIGYWFAVQGTVPGRTPKWTSLLIQTLKVYSLWILMGECLLFATFATVAVAPWFIPIFGLLTAVGIAGHIRYQQKAMMASTV